MERYNEEELLYLMRCGNEVACDILVEIYYGYIRYWVWPYQFYENLALDLDDYVQVGMMAFWNALDNYRTDRSTSLKTYMKSTVYNRVINYINSQKSRRLLKNKLTISLDDSLQKREGMHYDETIEDTSIRFQPQKVFEVKETTSGYLSDFQKRGSQMEYIVMIYLLKGYPVKEISKILNMPLKSVYNAAYRAHKKVGIDE